MAEREAVKRKLDEDGSDQGERAKRLKIDDGPHQLNHLIHDEEILISEIKKLIEIDTKADPFDKISSILNSETNGTNEAGADSNDASTSTRSNVEQIFKICADWRANFTSRIENRASIRIGEILQLFAKNMVPSSVDAQTHLLDMTSLTTKALIKALPRDILTAVLSQLISNGTISFPYKKFYVTPADQLFANLQKYQPEISEKRFSPNACGPVDKYLFPIPFNGKYTVLSNNDANYNAIDVIGDHFTEEQRMNAIRADQKLSPMEYWKQHVYDIVKGVSQTMHDLNAESMREELYKQVKECTQFKPTVAFSVYKMLKAKRILDFSAGWGDRLIAAMAVEDLEQYLAFDPNTALRSGHLNAVKTLWRNKEDIKDDEFPKEVRVIYEPFEKATIPADLKFDLCFTSPPFFSFEIYSKTEGQSVQSYPQFDQWMKKFLFVALEKAWNALETNGHLAIHITDAGKNRVVEPMNLYIQYTLPNAKYCGVIGTEGGSNKIFPIWVWQKTSEKTNSRDKNDAIDLMKKYYNRLYERASY